MSIQQLSLLISGMSCASCVRHVESALKTVPGVVDAQVNLATDSARVNFIASEINPDFEKALIVSVSQAGYKAELKNEHFLANTLHPKNKLSSGWPVLVAMCLSAPLLIPMIAMLFGRTVTIPIEIQFILATLVQFILGARFYKGSWNAIKTRISNMDLLVAIGTSAGWFLSVWMWFAQTSEHGKYVHVYFESSSVVIAIVLLGKWLEDRAKYRASAAIHALCSLRPLEAKLLVHGSETTVSIAQIQPNDTIVIRAGERIPVDAVVTEGSSYVDESMLTGESIPVNKKTNDKLTAGTINIDQRLVARVTAVGGDTVLSKIIQLVENAQASKAPIQQLVDKVSSIFVPVVLLVACVTFMAWFYGFHENFSTSLMHAVTVLVVACPCAMGLATPAAIIVGTGVAAKSGILILNVEALERAAKLQTIAFDKTGTLTFGKPKLNQFILHDKSSKNDFLLYACALQSGSSHPLAQAFLADLSPTQKSCLATLAVTDSKVIVGCGMQGTIQKETWLIGQLDWLSKLGADLTAWQAEISNLHAEGSTISALALQTANQLSIKAIFGFCDQPKPEASEVLRSLRAQHLHLAMLSGDNPGAVNLMAQQLGFDVQQDRIEAGLLPQDKISRITAWQENGERVAMVGDGINDTPAVAAASVGIAMGNGADIAMHAADITLLRGDLKLIPAALDLSKKTVAKIKGNLFWAFFYNAVAIPLAASGYFNPMFAGVLMALSSVSVLSNALLLQRWRVP